MIGWQAGTLPGCRLLAGDPTRPITTLEIDSRLARPGGVFVAIRGGHAHTADAQRAGVAVLIDEAAAVNVSRTADAAVLTAPSTIGALAAIGQQNAARATRCVTIGVTGSSGKTTTKDILDALIGPQRPVVASRSGYNNEIGLPHTLCQFTAETRVGVCEMAMRGAGQISRLAALARPRIGMITNVGEAHIALLGSREAIADAKQELLDALPAGAVAIIPADESLLTRRVRHDLEYLRFGAHHADVTITGREPLADGMRVELDVLGRRLIVTTNLRGAHNAHNLAAAFAACAALGVDLATCAASATSIQLQQWRSQRHGLPGGGVLVNDAYNANPSSTEAALRALAEHGSGRLIAVLGPMAELGDQTAVLQRRVGALLAPLGYQVLITVGRDAVDYNDGAAGAVAHYPVASVDDAVTTLLEILAPGDRVLVKASRAARLETIADAVMQRLQHREDGS
jgi:UDP-N-acetylmuramoyl-tripeptide--D-alanyl-D-alanine ligase